MENKKTIVELQNQGMREKYAFKIKLEEIRHKNIMEALSFMAKNKIKTYQGR